jgi:hypothetical protein
MKNRPGNFHSCQDTFFLNQEPGFPESCFGNAAECGMIAVANILGKSQINEFVRQFF